MSCRHVISSRMPLAYDDRVRVMMHPSLCACCLRVHAMMSLLAFVFISLCFPSVGFCCTNMYANTIYECTKATYLLVEGRYVVYGEQEVRLRYRKPTKIVSINCRQHSHKYKLKHNVNQVRVSSLKDRFYIKMYWCDSFDGPTKVDQQCAIEAFSTACPHGSLPCVYEVETDHFSSKSVRNPAEVKEDIAAKIRHKAAPISVSQSEERTILTTYSFQSKSYIVVPAGFRFCSYSKVTSERFYDAATGFRWRCGSPRYLRTKAKTKRCTNVLLCDKQSPCPVSKKSPNSGTKCAVLQPVGILLIVFAKLFSMLAS